MKNPTSRLPRYLCFLLCLLTLQAAYYAGATNIYWDINGATAGAGGATPAGTWESAFWSTSSAGTAATTTWAETGDFPEFSAGSDATGSYTVTANANHTIAGMLQRTSTGTVTISGTGALTISGGVQQGFFSSGFLTINNKLTGTGGVISQSGQLFLNGNNDYSGGTTPGSGLINFNNGNSLGSGNIIMSASGGALICEGTSAITIPNNWTISLASATINCVGNTAGITYSGTVALGANSLFIGCGGSTANIDIFSGVISGTGNLGRSVGQTTAGIVKLTGANTYTGKSSFQTGITYVNSLNSVTAPAPQASSSLGVPSNAANGTLSIGGTTFAATLVYVGTGETTDRIIDLARTTGGATIQNDGTGALTFTANPNSASVAGAKTLTLQGANTGANTISGAIVDSSSGATTLTKAGAGKWVLSGANTYSGNTTVSVGTLAQGAANVIPFGAGKGTFAVSSGATFDLGGFDCSVNGFGTSAGFIDNTGAGAVTLTIGNNNGAGTHSGVIKNTGGTLSITKTGTGTSVLSGANTYVGKTIVNAGGLTINTSGDACLGAAPASPVADQLTLNAGTTFAVGSAANITLSPNRGITLGGAATISLTSKDLTVPGIIAGVGGSLTKSGANALILSGANTFDGGVTLATGTLTVNNDSALGSGTLTITPTGVCTVAGKSGTTTLANPITVNAGGGQVIDFFATAGNALTLNGQISGSANIFRGNGGGAGNLTLNGNNSTYSGTLTLAQGPLVLGHKNALGTSTFVVTPGSVAISLAANTALTGANAVANAITLNGTLPVTTASDLELSGIISGASGAVTNGGTAKLILSGANTYGGATTVGAGTLLANNTTGSGTGSGAVTVKTGATLGGTGSIGGLVTVNSGGTLAPGASIGTLTLAVPPNLGGTMSMEIDRNGGSPVADKLVVSSGTLAYSGALSLVNLGAALQLNDTFTLFNAASYSGFFSPITPANPGPGLAWDISHLAVNGTIKVVCDGTLAASGGSNKYICSGSSVGIGGSPTATGGSGSGYTYSWSPVTGLDDPTLANPTASTTNTTLYTVTVTDSVGCTAVASTTVNVNAAPAISAGPANQTVCSGSTATFSVAATGSGLSYSWATNNNFGWGSAWSTSGSGSTFRASSTDNDFGDTACTSFSSANDINSPSGNALGMWGGFSGDEVATRTFAALAAGQVVSVDFDNGNVDIGSKVGFSLQTSGAADALQFYFLGGAANYKYWDTSASEQDSGIPIQRTGVRVQFVLTSASTYSLIVTPCGGTATTFTGAFSGTIAQLKLFNGNTSGGSDKNIYFNNFLAGGYTDNADNYSGDFAGQDKGNQPITLGNGGSSYTTPTLTVADSGTQYQVTVSGCGGAVLSTNATVTVNPLPTVSVNSLTICAGDSATVTATTSASSPTYLWNDPGASTTASITVSPSATTTYTVTVTDGTTTCANSGSGTVTVNPLPTVSVNSPAICAGGSATLTAMTSANSPSYLWNDPGASTTASITVSPSSTTTYTVTVTDGTTTCANSGSGTVTVNPLPTVNVNSQTICAGASATLTATTSASSPSYLWSPGGETTASITVSPASTTTYTVMVTDGTTTCVNSGSGTVTVNPLPTVSVNSQTICAGNSATLTATTSASSPTYQWSPGGATTPSITVSPALTTTYTVTVTDGVTTCANSGSGTVTVNPLPTVSVNSQSICAGGSATLTATTSASSPSYLWSPGGQTTASITVSPASTTTYMVTVTDGATGCANSGSGTVTVVPVPVVTTDTTNQTVCAGSTVTWYVVASGTGLTYQWQRDGTNLLEGADGFTGVTTASLTNSAVGAQDSLDAANGYACIITSNPCTPVSSTVVSLTVNPLPTVSVNSETICAGGSATLTAMTGASSPTYVWSPGGATTASITVSPASTTTYTVTVTDGATGCANTGSGTVTVNPLPTVSVNSATICAGSSATLTATTSPGSPSYLWSPGGATTASITVSPTSTTTYTVTVTDGVTSCANSGSGTVTVTAYPAVTIETTNGTACPGSAVIWQIAATGTSLTYQWQRDGTNLLQGVDGFTGVTTASLTNSAVGAQDGVDAAHGYACVISSGACSLSSTLVSLTVIPLPTVSVNSETVCAGGSATLTATTSASSPTYLWSPGGGTTPSITVSPTSTTTYTVTVTDGGSGCGNSGSGTVTVNPLPTVSVNSESICAGSSAALTATTSASSPAYLWSPGGATTASITVSPSATTTYTVTVTDGATGCANSGSGTVTVIPLPTVSVNSPSICEGGSATLTATTSASSPSYLWNDPGNSTTASITVSPASTTTYTVTVTDGVTGCANSGSGTVPVSLCTYYWDVNGATPGAGGPMPSGNWEDMNWTSDSTGSSPTGNWLEGNFPVFSAGTDATGAYTITAGSDHTISGLQVASGTVSINGPGRLFIANGMQGFVGTNLTINAVLAGTGGFQTAAGNNVYLNGTNTFSGGVNLNAGSTYITNNNALGTGVISPIAGGASPNFSALFLNGSSPITLANNYTVATANAGINFITTASTPLTNSGDVDLQQTLYCRNAGPAAGAVTFGGVMSGPGGLVLSGNGGLNDSTTALNGANTYSGKTIIGQGGAARMLVNINSIQPVASATPNSLGLPPDATTGQIDIGHAGLADALRYTGTGDTTDRIINNANTSGGMWLFADGSGPITYSGNITAATGGTAARTVTIEGSSTALNTISGAIQDSTGGANNQIAVTKDGTGTWVLSGNNTFSGTLTIQGGGTLKIGADNTLPYGAGKANTTVSINGGGATTTLDLNGHNINVNAINSGASGQLNAIIDNTSGSGTYTITTGNNNQGGTWWGPVNNTVGTVQIVKIGTGSISLRTPGNFSGGVALNGGQLFLVSDGALGTGNGTLSFNGGMLKAQQAAAFSINASRLTYVDTGGGFLDPAFNCTITFLGRITGPGTLNACRDGTGGFILANTANDWQGGLYIGKDDTRQGGSGGVFIKLGASNVIPHGSSAGDVYINSARGGKLDMAGFSTTINGLGGDAAGAIVDNSGSTASTLTVGDNNATSTFPGVLKNTGSGTLGLTKIGSGILTLSGPNTYGGATTINGGTLALATGGAVGSGTVAVGAGAALDVSAVGLTLGGSQTLQAGGTGGSSATIATASGKNLTLGATSPLQFTAYDGSTVPLTIAGAGSLAIVAGNPVTVTTTVVLGPGSYKLVQIGAGNSTAVTGTPASSATVNGSGMAAGGTASLRITGGELWLDICIAPTAFNVTGGGAYCSGGSGVAIGLAGSQTGYNYQLKLGPGNVGLPVPGNGGALSFGPQTAAGTYTVVATSVIGGCTAPMTGSATVTVNPLPTVSVNSPSICAGSSATLTATTSASSPSYLWSPGGATTASITVSPASTTTYTVTVTDGVTGCGNSGSGTVTVNPTPTASAGVDQTVCANSPVDIGSSPTASGGTAPYTYSWSPSTGLSDATAANPTATVSSTTTYTVTVTDANGCTATSSMTVTIIPTPIIASIMRSGTDVTLVWSTLAGQTYRVEYKNNLTDASWTALTPDVVAGGATASKTDVAPASPQRFYRIQVVCP